MVNVGELVLDRREALAFFRLEKSYTSHQLRRAYRQAVLRHHPDRNPQDVDGTTRTMTRIIELYKVLSTPKTEEEKHTERFYEGFII